MDLALKHCMHRPQPVQDGTKACVAAGAAKYCSAAWEHLLLGCLHAQVEHLSAQLDEAQQDLANRPEVAVNIHELEHARRQACLPMAS